MNVLIRADASVDIGSGHVMRCKTLADELYRRGAEIRFVSRNHPGNLVTLLRSAGYPVTVLPAPQPPGAAQRAHVQDYALWLGVTQQDDAAQTIEALNDFEPDWLVVDHYALDATWESLLRPHVKRIFAIDDLANRPHDCDLLLDQNWFGEETEHRYTGLVNEKCQCLLGPRYALLQPVFGQLRGALPQREGHIRRVLVFFGGADSSNQTAKALRALSRSKLDDIAVDVVIGSTNPHAPEIESLVVARANTSLHRQLPSLAGLMARADLMLCAGGSVTWERCCLGLPSIVVTASENQRDFTAVLSDTGVQHGLGLAAKVRVEDWAKAVQGLRNDPAQIRAYAEATSRVTDGFGIYRLAATTMETQPLRLRLRRAMPEDEPLLLEWANDPAVRRHAFSSKTISPETHHEWFYGKLADPDCLLLIGEDVHGLPIGQVRFDCRANEALIDISVDSTLRGRGLGKALLRSALEVLRTEGRKEPAVGEVLAKNHASHKMFLRSGFEPSASPSNRGGVVRFVLPY